jgi:cadmium resistance protein CadD (predicted permease)
MRITLAKTFAAALVLFVTTADDALWLIPFVASPKYTSYQRIQHSLLFILTIQIVVWVSVAISFGLKASMSREIDEALPLVGAILCWIMASYLFVRSMCKRHMKNAKNRHHESRRTEAEQQQQEMEVEEQQQQQQEVQETQRKKSAASCSGWLSEEEQQEATATTQVETENETSQLLHSEQEMQSYSHEADSEQDNNTSTIAKDEAAKAETFLSDDFAPDGGDAKEENSRILNSAATITTPLLQPEPQPTMEEGKALGDHGGDDNNTIAINNTRSNNEDVDISSFVEGDDVQAGCGTVFSLAFLGALDELAYFPTLLIGGTFSALELSVGALVACVVILFVITTILARIKPVLDCMDRIPLYAIIAVFATLLTIDAIMEWGQQ